MEMGSLKLHLGCGLDWRAGYLNVDLLALSDLVAWSRREGRAEMFPAGIEFMQFDLRRPWPWADGSVAEVLCYQTLEFFTDAELKHVLAETRRVLAPGAVFRGTVPNLTAVYNGTVVRQQDPPHAQVAGGPYREGWMNALQWYVLGGGNHRQVFVLEMLDERLRGAGFKASIGSAYWYLSFEARVDEVTQ